MKYFTSKWWATGCQDESVFEQRHEVSLEIIKRETFKQDALHAWEAYQQNGLHLTLEETDNWLAQLEAGEDAELPKYHV